MAGPSLVVVGLWALTFGGGCSSSGSGSSGPLPPAATCNAAPVAATAQNSVTSISENVDSTCESVVGTAPWKTGAPGAPCTDPLDCAPVCVICKSGTHHTLATWCNDGVCETPEHVACMVLGTTLNGCS
jgi:hypothetical protein